MEFSSYLWPGLNITCPDTRRWARITYVYLLVDINHNKLTQQLISSPAPGKHGSKSKFVLISLLLPSVMPIYHHGLIIHFQFHSFKSTKRQCISLCLFFNLNLVISMQASIPWVLKCVFIFAKVYMLLERSYTLMSTLWG